MNASRTHLSAARAPRPTFASSQTTPTPSPAPGPTQTQRFADLVAGPVERSLEQERSFRTLMADASSGRAQSQRDLLVMQAQVYQYSHHVEVATRVVDRAASSVKQLLGTQF